MSESFATAFNMAPPKEMNQPNMDMAKEKGKYLTAKGTGKAFMDGWYYNTTGTTDNVHKEYLYMWQHACAFTKWVPSNQFLHSGRSFNPGTMTLERFGLIGMDRKCYWGCIGVLWKRPLPVEKVLPHNGGGSGGNNKPKPKPKPPAPKPKPPAPKPKPPAPKPKPPAPKPKPTDEEIIKEIKFTKTKDVKAGKCYRIRRYIDAEYGQYLSADAATSGFMWVTRKGEPVRYQIWKAIDGVNGKADFLSF